MGWSCLCNARGRVRGVVPVLEDCMVSSEVDSARSYSTSTDPLYNLPAITDHHQLPLLGTLVMSFGVAYTRERILIRPCLTVLRLHISIHRDEQMTLVCLDPLMRRNLRSNWLSNLRPAFRHTLTLSSTLGLTC